VKGLCRAPSHSVEDNGGRFFGMTFPSIAMKAAMSITASPDPPS
jgi:hypothetical protein